MGLVTMETCGFDLQHDSFAALVKTVEGTTSLVTLRRIDDTVDALGGIRATLSGLAMQARTIVEAVKELRPIPGRFLDEDCSMVRRLKVCADDLECSLEESRIRRSTIDQNSEFKQHHCDLLHSSYEDMERSGQELLESMEDLRRSVIVFDTVVRRAQMLAHNTRIESLENFKKLDDVEVFDVGSAYEAFVTNRQR